MRDTREFKKFKELVADQQEKAIAEILIHAFMAGWTGHALNTIERMNKETREVISGEVQRP